MTLSQATLVDSQPSRHEQNMARWTFAGSVGVVLGPLLLSRAAYIGFGWRGLFFVLAGLAVLLLIGAWRILHHGREILLETPSAKNRPSVTVMPMVNGSLGPTAVGRF